MVMFNFKLRGKIFSIDVSECRNFLQKGTGLMFRKKSKPLLFIFNKPVSEAIHSFFCVDFIGIWLNRGRVVEVQYVKPWRFFIKPVEKFDRLLEIPFNNKNFNGIKLLIQK